MCSLITVQFKAELVVSGEYDSIAVLTTQIGRIKPFFE